MRPLEPGSQQLLSHFTAHHPESSQDAHPCPLPVTSTFTADVPVRTWLRDKLNDEAVSSDPAMPPPGPRDSRVREEMGVPPSTGGIHMSVRRCAAPTVDWRDAHVREERSGPYRRLAG